MKAWRYPGRGGCLGRGALDAGGGEIAKLAHTSAPRPTCQQVLGLPWAMHPKHGEGVNIPSQGSEKVEAALSPAAGSGSPCGTSMGDTESLRSWE